MTKREREERFQALVEKHEKILYKVCHSYCKSPGDREDLAQEILFQLWRSFGGFDERVRFSTWMYRIALNVAISFYRRERVRARQVIPAGAGLFDTAPEAPSQTDEAQMLYRWIGELDPLNKALLILYLDGNSYAEIAEVLGITETNVATKISRVKDVLREQAGGKHGTR